MLAAIYSAAAALPLYESAWGIALLWLLRCLVLWSFMPSAYFCCCAACSECDSTTPSQLEVTLSGFTDSVCGDCEVYNGTFVVENNTNTWAFCSAELDCCWGYHFDAATCDTSVGSGFNVDRLEVTVVTGGIGLTVRLWSNPQGTGAAHCIWGNTAGGPTNCHEWADEELTNNPIGSSGCFLVPGAFCLTVPCTHDASSAFVTSL